MERSFLWLCRVLIVKHYYVQTPEVLFIVVQLLTCIRLFVIPLITAYQAPLSFTISQSVLKFMSIESVMPSSHLILCRPLLLLPPIPPSIMVFSNESALGIRWSKYWSFSFSISPSNEYSVFISFRIDWFGLLAVQGILKSLLQHHNLKASILQHSAFFMVQPSRPFHTWLLKKTIALTTRTFVGKVMSLTFNMLSRFVTAFLPRSEHLSISGLHTLSAVILEPKKIKPVIASTFPLLFVMKYLPGSLHMVYNFHNKVERILGLWEHREIL